LSVYSILSKIIGVGKKTEPLPPPVNSIERVSPPLPEAQRNRLRRSCAIRAVDAGSCNGCELEIHATNNCRYDIERFGFHYTASPRFADILLVTGPVTRNMETALRMTYDATPSPKRVVAMGDCAITCGLFGADGYAIAGAVADIIPVDVIVHGCPPEPCDIIHGLRAAVE